jgi:hypothetical protein
MNRIIKSAKLDFYSSESIVITLILLWVFNIALSFFSRNPLYAITIGTLYGVIQSGTIFLVHSGSHNGKLYGILPLKKYEIVMGRYLYGMIIGVINLVFAYILALSIGMIFNQYSTFEIMNTSIPPMAAMMFIYYCISIGVSYPLYFAVGYKSFVAAPNAIIIILFNLYVIPYLYTVNSSSPGWLARNRNLFIMQLINKYPLFTIGMGFVIGLAFIFISAAIACIIYKRKEI